MQKFLLLEEFLKLAGISQVAFAKHVGGPLQRIHEIVHGKRGITPDTAWRCAQAFGTTPVFWMNLQTAHDLALGRPVALAWQGLLVKFATMGRRKCYTIVNICPFAENKMTIPNYRPSECKHRPTGPAAPKCEFGLTSKQAGGECFGRATVRW